MKTVPTGYYDEWECYCSECDWYMTAGRNPKFHSARKHHRETGHTTFISRISLWSYGDIRGSTKGKQNRR